MAGAFFACGAAWESLARRPTAALTGSMDPADVSRREAVRCREAVSLHAHSLVFHRGSRFLHHAVTNSGAKIRTWLTSSQEVPSMSASYDLELAAPGTDEPEA